MALVACSWTGCAAIWSSGLTDPAPPRTAPVSTSAYAAPGGVMGLAPHSAAHEPDERYEAEAGVQLGKASVPGPPARRKGDASRTAEAPAARQQTSKRLHDFQRAPATVPISRTASAMLHANLSPAQCRTRLAAKKASFKRQGPTPGIANPLRITGSIGGVRFVAPGGKSPYGLLDCRLALTLIEFAAFLEERGIVEVLVDNFYRPNARLPSKRAKKSQHAYGLAIDVMALEHRDGRVFDVEDDWGAGIETEACGPKATLSKPTDNTVALRNLFCELVQAQLFHHHLTPSYDRAHRNHLHLDIKRDAKSLWVR